MPNKLILIAWDDEDIPEMGTLQLLDALKTNPRYIFDKIQGLKIIDLDKEIITQATDILNHPIPYTSNEAIRSSHEAILDMERQQRISVWAAAPMKYNTAKEDTTKDDIKTLKSWFKKIKGMLVLFEIKSVNNKAQYMHAGWPNKEFKVPLLSGPGVAIFLVSIIDRFVTKRVLIERVKKYLVENKL